MENPARKAPEIKVYDVPFDRPSEKFHQTTAVLNITRDKLYVTDSSASNASVYVGRLKLDGNYDPDFGDQSPGGWTATELNIGGTLPYRPAGLVPRSDGGVVTGLVNNNGLGLACFKADGTLDTSFGANGDGKVIFGTPSVVDAPGHYVRKSPSEGLHPHIDGSAGVLALGDDEAIYALIGGRVAPNSALVRFTSSGALDSSFGTQGVVNVRYEAEHTGVVAVIAVRERKVVVVGYVYSRAKGDRLFMARYNDDGSPDPDFGSGGFLLYDWEALGLVAAPYEMEFSTVVQHHDGGYFALGYASTAQVGRMAIVVRVNSKGVLVEEFNGGKPLLFQAYRPEAPGNYLDTDLSGGSSVQSDGRLIAGGGLDSRPAGGNERDMFIARITKEGQLDTSFTSTGWLTLQPGRSREFRVASLAVITKPDADVIYAAGDGLVSLSPYDHKGFVVEISASLLGKNGGK